MAFNPNVRNDKKTQDTPFLTLSQRAKEGITSENIQGANAAYSTQKTNQTNIFGQEEGQGVKNDGPWFMQEEKSGEDYIQEDEQGNVNFDEQGFYDDAWGISLGNATDPMKAGSSKDPYEAKNELTTMIKQGAADNEIEDKKEELKGLGVSSAEIDTITDRAGGAQKSGAIQTANGTVTSTAGDSVSKTKISGDPINGNTSDLIAWGEVNIPGKYDRSLPTQGSKLSGTNGVSGVSAQAEKKDNKQELKTLGANALGAVGGKALGQVYEGTIGKPISAGCDKISEGCGKLVDGAKNLVGLGEDKDPKTVEEAKKNVDDKRKIEKSAEKEKVETGKNVDESKTQVDNAEGEKVAAEGEQAAAEGEVEKCKFTEEELSMTLEEIEIKQTALDEEINSLQENDTRKGELQAEKLKMEALQKQKEAELQNAQIETSTAEVKEESAEVAVDGATTAVSTAQGALTDANESNASAQKDADKSEKDTTKAKAVLKKVEDKTKNQDPGKTSDGTTTKTPAKKNNNIILYK